MTIQMSIDFSESNYSLNMCIQIPSIDEYQCINIINADSNPLLPWNIIRISSLYEFFEEFSFEWLLLLFAV